MCMDIIISDVYGCVSCTCSPSWGHCVLFLGKAAVFTAVSCIMNQIYMFTFGSRKFLYIVFSLLNREILPLPRGVLDMFKEGKQNEDFLLVV